MRRFDSQPRTMSHAECTPCAETSWVKMVAHEAYGVEAACITCGCLLKTKRKRMSVSRLMKGVQGILDEHGEHRIVRTQLNVLGERSKISQDCSCCLCCHHWIENRLNKNIVIVPLLSVHLQIRFVAHGKKKVDTRILHKIASNLNEPNNFYRTLFGKDELELFGRLSQQPMTELKHELVAFYYAQNNAPLFVHNAKMAELLRERKK